MPVDIFDEVEQLTETKIKRLGLTLFEPGNETYTVAGGMRNSCSFQDRVCVQEAKDNGWSVITSDKAMKKWCTREGIPSYWGLQVMLNLVEGGLLAKTDAIETARLMQDNNAMITEEILNDFISKL